MIEFNEIPCGNSYDGKQDTFELFARDFLSSKGFEIIVDPARGADNGADLIVRENLTSKDGKLITLNWLVSCKHYSHSKKSITIKDEVDILDRVMAHNCDGFIYFYSTLPSSGLLKKIEGLKKHIHCKGYDHKKIEHEILGFASMENLFMRYFPNSYQRWKDLVNYREPSILFDYYLEHELKYQVDLFQRVHGSNDNILKALRNTDNFNSFIEYSSIRLCIENTDQKLDKLIRLQNDPNRTSLGQTLLKDVNKLYDELLTPYLSEKHSIPLSPGSVLLQGRNFTRGKDDGTILLYPNALFLNVPEYKGQKQLYEKLKKMI